jgi:hypothetical protein
MTNLEKYKKDGFFIVKRVFTLAEINHFRKITEDYFSKGSGFSNSDGVTQPEFISIPELIHFNKILETPKLITELTNILGDYRFCKHSDLAMNRKVGWHKDGLNGKYKEFEKHGPWEKIEAPYKIAKVLIYLQDHTNESEWEHALSVKIGSHLVDNLVQGKDFNLRPSLGDIIIFDQRLTHQAKYNIKGKSNRILITLGFGQNDNTFTDEFEKGTLARQNEQNSLKKQI